MKRISTRIPKLLALVFSVLMTISLCACGGEETGGFLYQATGNEHMQAVTGEQPTYMFAFSYAQDCGADINDSEQIAELVGLFTAIEKGEEIDLPEDAALLYSLDFTWDEETCCVDFFDGIAGVPDAEGQEHFYEVSGCEDFFARMDEIISDYNTDPMETAELLYDANDLKVCLLGHYESDGIYRLDLRLENNSEKELSVQVLEPAIDGKATEQNGYLGTIPNGTVDYTAPVFTDGQQFNELTFRIHVVDDIDAPTIDDTGDLITLEGNF